MSNPLYYPNRDMLASGFPTNWTLLKRLMWVRIMQGGSIAPTYETVTGNPVSFTTVRPAPLRQLSVAFSPVQSGTGDPSPDNVRPISGWSSLTVEQRGVNLWDEEWEVGGIDSSTGRDGTDPNSWRTVNYIPIKPNTEYYVASSATNKSIRARFYAADKSYIGYAPKSGSTDTGHAFVSPENAYYLRFNPAITGVPNHDISINYPATDTAYHAYNPSSRSISISLGSTYYSGQLDVVTGVVTVTMASVTFDGSQQDSQFAFATGTGKNRITWNGYQFVGKADVPILSDKLKPLTTYSAAPEAWEVSNSASPTAARCFIGVPTTIASVEDWKAYVTQNNITLCYYLATPQTIQLTPQEVESLAGDNVLFSDANGDLTVEYRSN